MVATRVCDPGACGAALHLRSAPRVLAARRSGRRAILPIVRLPTNSSRTCAISDSPTSSCSPSWSTPTTGSWGYQTRATSRRRAATAAPTTCAVRRPAARAGHGRHPRLGPGALPQGRARSGRFDGSALYEHLDPRHGEHKDWNTYIFNYGRPEVENFLISNALYWLRRVSRRRPPRRRGGLHAVPRLRPRRPASGSQTVRRQREPRSGRASCASSTSGCTRGSPARW